MAVTGLMWPKACLFIVWVNLWTVYISNQQVLWPEKLLSSEKQSWIHKWLGWYKKKKTLGMLTAPSGQANIKLTSIQHQFCQLISFDNILISNWYSYYWLQIDIFYWYQIHIKQISSKTSINHGISLWCQWLDAILIYMLDIKLISNWYHLTHYPECNHFLADILVCEICLQQIL